MKAPLDRKLAEYIADLKNASKITEMILRFYSDQEENKTKELRIKLDDGDTIELVQVNSSETVPQE